MSIRGYLVHALTPLHAGTGQGVGLVDLPIAREVSTTHPFVPGSSVKGVLRAAAQASETGRGDESLTWRLFGPDRENTRDYAAAIRVSDARILLLPVRSDTGTFAWVTCPLVLRRWLRDLGPLAVTGDVPEPKQDECVTGEETVLSGGGTVVLDGLPFTARAGADALGASIAALLFPGDAWWQRALTTRLAVVDDDAFTWLAEKATDVRAHVRIGEAGVVEKGALWYEETLPPETVLAGVVQLVGNGRSLEPDAAWGVLDGITAAPIQLGGGATTGHGLSRIRWVGGGA